MFKIELKFKPQEREVAWDKFAVEFLTVALNPSSDELFKARCFGTDLTAV